MALVPHVLAAILWIGGALTVAASERTAPSRLCPEDAPDGVRLPPRPGCGPGDRRRIDEDAREFRDIDGVKLRVGGRVGVQYGIGR